MAIKKPSPQTGAIIFKNFDCLLMNGKIKNEIQNKIIIVAAQGTGIQKSCRSVL